MDDLDEVIVVPSKAVWSETKAKLLKEFGEQIWLMTVSERRNEIILNGSVHSEDAKAGIEALVRRLMSGREITNYLEVEGVLEPASALMWDGVEKIGHRRSMSVADLDQETIDDILRAQYGVIGSG